MARRTSRSDGPPAPGADILLAARDELVRADAKATTLFATSGVAVGAVLTGLLSGQWSPSRIHGGLAQGIWWLGAAAAGVALVCLAAAMHPRTRRRRRDGRLAAYFGDVVMLGPDELDRALAGGARAARIGVLVGVLALVIGLRARSGPAPAPAAAGPSAPPSSGPAALPTASTTPSLGTPSATVTPLPGGTTVRRTTGGAAITLRPSYGVDLDDDTSSNWNVGRGCCASDVSWDGAGSRLLISNDFAVATGPPEYATCANETAYTNGSIERGSLQTNENICVRTGGDRFALVTILSAGDEAIQFQATVWDPPFS